MEPNLTDEFLSKQKLPYTAYELRFFMRSVEGQEDVLSGIDVEPIRIERHGIMPGSGATAPSITAVDVRGVRFLGSARDYFATQDDARAAAKKAMANGPQIPGRSQYAEVLDCLPGNLDVGGERPIVEFEVEAMRECDGAVERTDPESAQFWGVYRRELPDASGIRYAVWLADFNSKPHAEAFADQLLAESKGLADSRVQEAWQAGLDEGRRQKQAGIEALKSAGAGLAGWAVVLTGRDCKLLPYYKNGLSRALKAWMHAIDAAQAAKKD